MTIAQAFNEITIAQGGTPNGGGTITGAIDALNDTLAGSDQAQGRTIEDAVRLLGQHIGGGSSVTVEALTATENKTYTAPEGKAYSPVTVNVSGGGSFGSLQFIRNVYDLPVVGNPTEGQSNLLSISSGDTVYAQGSYYAPLATPVAAGLTAVAFASEEYTECDAYVCGVDENFEYTSVTPWDGTVTVDSTYLGGELFSTYTLTVPELDFDSETWLGEHLILYIHS